LRGTETTYFFDGAPVNREYGKMGKSLKNMVTPDDMCDTYGADTFRVYEMSMGPLDASRPWETRAVVGSHRFLQRVWRNIVDEETGASRVTDEPADETTRRLVHRTIERVSIDMDGLHFNTAIARLTELNNHVVKSGTTPREVAEPLVLMLAPLAPHVAEELWTAAGSRRHVGLRAVPGGRSRAAGRGVGHLRHPGGRQGARPHRGAALDRRRRPSGTGVGVRGRAASVGRSGHPDRRRPRATPGQRRPFLMRSARCRYLARITGVAICEVAS